MNKINVCISGHICRDNSSNLYSFWQGFINLQRSLPNGIEVKIFGHSWNPEFNSLAKAVYGTECILSEEQPSFVDVYGPLINPVNKYEKGLVRHKSRWFKNSPQLLVGITKSRSNAIKLLSEHNVQEDEWVLATRWDQGCAGSKEVNIVNIDKSLPKEYFYLSYFSEVDEGYADMWFFTNKKLASKFEGYNDFIVDCLAGENDYFEKFTSSGWPIALPRNPKPDAVIRLNGYINKIASLVLNLSVKALSGTKLYNKVFGLRAKFEKIVSKPLITGENSLKLDSKTQVVFPSYQGLNIHAMLKYFCISNGLREDMRFLDIKDFELGDKGLVINPLDFCYVIYSHSSFSDCWEMAIGQALENLPYNCKKIYLITDDSDASRSSLNSIELCHNVTPLFYNNKDKYTKRLTSTFSNIDERFEHIYFVHEDMPLTDKVDSVLLNSLFHYISHSNEFYIKLVDTNYVDKKEKHINFPFLVKNYGGYSFSVQPSLMKLKHMIPFLQGFDCDIYSLEQMAIESNLLFSAVKGDRKVGKYLIANQSFPHIATAISKGKWCTDEWPKEIRTLADKYKLNLSERGMLG
jgi:hypothetical protein